MSLPPSLNVPVNGPRVYPPDPPQDLSVFQPPVSVTPLSTSSHLVPVHFSLLNVPAPDQVSPVSVNDPPKFHAPAIFPASSYVKPL